MGGLFLHPDLRAAGLGGLLARSRYLFIARHRARFADTIIAELRGQVDEKGESPFWDGLGGRFFQMPFHEADEFNSQHGNQFIADLMPKYPIYTALLPEDAQATIGKPHDNGVPAMRMLEKEGFSYNGYIDIFDGGPTMVARTDQLRTVKAAKMLPVAEIADETEGARGYAAAGTRGGFRAWKTSAQLTEKGLVLPAEEAALMKIEQGEMVSYVGS